MNKHDTIQDAQEINIKLYVDNKLHKWQLHLPQFEVITLTTKIDNIITQLDTISTYTINTIKR